MKRLLIAIAAACALHTVATAHDITFTYSYDGTMTDTPPDGCIPDLRTCEVRYNDEWGTFTLTLPDDTQGHSSEIVYGETGLETINFGTAGGKLLYYDLVDDFLDTSDMSWRHLWLDAGGGGEYGYLTTIQWGDFLETSLSFTAEGPPPTPVPEPESALLLLGGLAAVAACRRSGKVLLASQVASASAYPGSRRAS